MCVAVTVMLCVLCAATAGAGASAVGDAAAAGTVPIGKLSAVSCFSATACTAVGSFPGGAGRDLTLADRWDGSAWTSQITPSPVGEAASLDGVSCPSETVCVAVGSLRTQAGRMSVRVEGWDGLRWSVEQTPRRPGATGGSLSGVYCNSPRSCLAVGDSVGAHGVKGSLIEHWNGVRWTVQRTGRLAGIRDMVLDGVSCSGSRSCTAIGWFDRRQNGQTFTLAQRWNGLRWSVERTPNGLSPDADRSDADNVLSGVACMSSTACLAVGQSSEDGGICECDASGTNVALAERWNGKKWSISPLGSIAPTFGGENTSLAAVACMSATSCIAVGCCGGMTQTEPLIERWNGSGWSTQAAPPDNQSSDSSKSLHGVACTRLATCEAVGHTDNGAGQVTLALQWDGSRWTIQSTD
jgi:hypothetical protein